MTILNGKAFVVIDVGCLECHVDSVPIGMYATRQEAEDAAKKRNEETKHWRDSGQTYAEVFEVAGNVEVVP